MNGGVEFSQRDENIYVLCLKVRNIGRSQHPVVPLFGLNRHQNRKPFLAQVGRREWYI